MNCLPSDGSMCLFESNFDNWIKIKYDKDYFNESKKDIKTHLKISDSKTKTVSSFIPQVIR